MPFSAPLFTSHAPDDSATPRRSYFVCALRSWTPERLVQQSAEAGRSIYDTLRFRVGQTRSLLHILAKVSSLKVVERDGGSNPAARPRGRLDAFEARFFGTLLLVRSQHSGSSLVTWA